LSSETFNVRSDMTGVGTRPYAKFVSELRLALLTTKQQDVAPLLDGLAGERCLALVRPKSIRRLGAFFTPSSIAERVVNQLEVRAWADATAFDPACGAGDLLLPIARRLPIKQTVSATLQFWNDRISGCDLSPEFIEAAKLRLVLLAMKRGCRLDDSSTNLVAFLTNIVVADGLSVSHEYSKSSYIVMNPPYGRIASGEQQWREGLVTAAALFVERAARLSSPGAQIAALLPEVLRTGSSYEQWRTHIGRLIVCAKPRSIGLFSQHANVDVFMQHFTKRQIRTSEISAKQKNLHEKVGDHFHVAVGTVVPHRHPVAGPESAYLHPRNAAPWGEIRRISETRKFEGRTFAAPFVVIRRTSRPGDRHRATATLLMGKRRVAVENHLIVMTPKRGGVPICRILMRLLRSSKTDSFLNRIMRCRHLTTGSVSLLPWDLGGRLVSISR
jgi:hypothetical protein